MGIENKVAEPITNCAARGLRHIAFIMDGNGRWAKQRGLPRELGHTAGAANFKKITRYCSDIGIPAVTVYAFSTENWKRSKTEVSALMRLFGEYLTNEFDEMMVNDLRVVFLGDRAPLSNSLKVLMERMESASVNNSRLLNIAINYGGRAEIVQAVNKLIAEGRTDITEEDITSHLYTAHCPPPDLVVRTGAEMRLSNFLIWQSAYSELYFSDVLWPDLTPGDIDAAVAAFFSRERRFGNA